MSSIVKMYRLPSIEYLQRPDSYKISNQSKERWRERETVFFGDFRCGMLLFVVILVIYKYKNK